MKNKGEGNLGIGKEIQETLSTNGERDRERITRGVQKYVMI